MRYSHWLKSMKTAPRLLLAILFCFAAKPATVPVTDDMLENPDPADWLMWRRTLNSWGYSPLNQITRANVAG